MTAGNEEWGEERLIEAMKECEALPAGEIVQKLLTAADKFVAGARQYDDMTLVAIKVLN